MGLLREIRDRLKYWWWDRQMHPRRSVDEMWLWEDVRVNGAWDKRIRVFARPRSWPSMLVALEMVASGAEAQRLLKAGGLEMQDWTWQGRWEPVTLKTPLPDQPFHLRRGKRCYGVKTLWLPPSGISERQGEEMLRKFA